MSKETNYNKLYVYLDRFVDGISGTYRQLEEDLGIDHVTIQRIVTEYDTISSKVHGIGNSKETFWILKKYETKKNIVIPIKRDIFQEKKETKEITFNTRQHRLCDYLLENCLGKESKIDKVDLLWNLKDHYFYDSDDLLITKDDIKKSRHNYAEYVKLTNDISFINLHGGIRQILIGSQGGRNGGVWALRLGEQHDAIDKILVNGLKQLNKFWAMKKAAEKQANTRLVFKGEKDIMDILRQFDPEEIFTNYNV